MRNRRARDHVLRKWRRRIRGESVRFAEQHWKFSEGSVYKRIGFERYRRRRGGGGGGTRWTSAGGEEALICSSVTHQSALSDSAEPVLKRGHKAQGQTNTTSH